MKIDDRFLTRHNGAAAGIGYKLIQVLSWGAVFPANVVNHTRVVISKEKSIRPHPHYIRGAAMKCAVMHEAADEVFDARTLLHAHDGMAVIHFVIRRAVQGDEKIVLEAR
jgi:hypothetical protein